MTLKCQEILNQPVNHAGERRRRVELGEQPASFVQVPTNDGLGAEKMVGADHAGGAVLQHMNLNPAVATS